MIETPLTEAVSYTLMIVYYIVAVVLMTISTKRFLKGDFRRILTWIVAAFWIMALPYMLLIMKEMGVSDPSVDLGWLIYLSLVLSGLCILKAAMLLYKFSKIFGFAEKPKK